MLYFYQKALLLSISKVIKVDQGLKVLPHWQTNKTLIFSYLRLFLEETNFEGCLYSQSLLVGPLINLERRLGQFLFLEDSRKKSGQRRLKLEELLESKLYEK